MVFEYFLEPSRAENKPADVFLLAVLLSTLGIFLSIILFPTYTSFTMLFFVALGVSPLLQQVFKDEELAEEKPSSLREALKHNMTVIKIYFYFFLGLVVTYTFWLVALRNYGLFLFKAQLDFLAIPTVTLTIQSPLSYFLLILFNNILVLTVFFFISIIFTVGSILVLGWNASLFAAFIVITAKRASAYGFLSAVTKIAVIYSIHAIPEFAAYFFAANAGAVLSLGIVKKRQKKKAFQNVVRNSAILILFSYAIIIVASFLEAFLLPSILNVFL